MTLATSWATGGVIDQKVYVAGGIGKDLSRGS